MNNPTSTYFPERLERIFLTFGSDLMRTHPLQVDTAGEAAFSLVDAWSVRCSACHLIAAGCGFLIHQIEKFMKLLQRINEIIFVK